MRLIDIDITEDDLIDEVASPPSDLAVVAATGRDLTDGEGGLGLRALYEDPDALLHAKRRSPRA